MIRINLLPVDKRKTERTPVPRLMLICANAAALILVALGAFWIWLLFNDVENEIIAHQKTLEVLEPRVQEFNELTTVKANLERKVNEIKSVVRREPEAGFWYAINALWDVINAHPKVWIEDLRILDERSVQGAAKRSELTIKPPPPYGVAFRANVAGRGVSEMTKFREALKSHPILQETLYYINFDVAWSVITEDGLDEPYSLQFSISLFGPSEKPKVVKKKKDKPEDEPKETPAGGTQ